ncbi:Uu.00g001520.m01.CDS01 [Anthostomella pinea]|uniref:Uu.00g001520.m01.CDS01 n=1 Tax=Anthostomella pinea TaxID=933095 RepID=A0AAI8VE33_9PEZI|nr:Uu.00g001520.m01.CDS01 [Anthostomella pinea]
MLTPTFSTAVIWLTIHALVVAQTDDDNHNSTTTTPSWHQYVRAPASSTVRPKAVLMQFMRGDVRNPTGLLAASGNDDDGGGSPTILRRETSTRENASLVLDFGQNVVGLLAVEFAGSVNGSVNGSASGSDGFPGLRLAFSEALEFLGERSDFTRSDNAGQGAGNPPVLVPSGTDQIAVKNEPYTWLNQWGCEYGSQVCSDGLHGFRYVKISLDALPADAPYTSSAGEVSINAVTLRWSGFRGTLDSYTGWFECSDAALTHWWFDGVYTTEMCTDVFRANDTDPRSAASPSLLNQWVVHDGAKRDRDPYVGDLAVAGLTSYLSHGSPTTISSSISAVRTVLDDLAAHQRAADGWIPPASIQDYALPLFDYPLWWVVAGSDYVMYSGNVSFIETHYAALVGVLDAYYPAHMDNKTGLLVRPDGYGDYAFVPREGSAAYYSALYVLALRRAADLAGFVGGGRDVDVRRWKARADRVARGVVDGLWDPAVGAFFDRKCDDGAAAGCEAHAQDGNSLAILSGVANATLAASALAYMSSAMGRFYGNAFYDAAGEALGAGFADRVYPFISYFEIAARFETAGVNAVDGVDGALDQIRRTWGWMAANETAGTHWEGIGAGGSKYEGGFTSLAHGWSTGVVPLLSTYVLGVKPVKPGFREWAVRPRPGGGLTWAQGEVPTPFGSLKVRWDRGTNGEGFVVTVRAPGGTNGTVSLPAAEGDVEGGVVWADGSFGVQGKVMGGFVEFAVEGGGEVLVGYPRTLAGEDAL